MSLGGKASKCAPIEVDGLIIQRERTAYSKTPDYQAAARIIFTQIMTLPPDRQEKYDTGSEMHGRELIHHVLGVIREAGYEDTFSLALSVNKHILYVRRVQ